MGRRVQAVAVQVGLFLLYVFGFGLTRLYAGIFHRSLIRGSPPGQASYWLPARGYLLDEETRRIP